MKNVWKLTLLGLFVLTLNLTGCAGPKTKTQCVADLASPNEKVVIHALLDIERNYPNNPEAIARVKSLLTDNRVLVRRKAARVLGAVHANVSQADLDDIVTLLNGPDKWTIVDGLKALRGLKAESTVPKILPLLQNPDANVKRDACRTLAVLGDKSIIPSIEPLLQDPDQAVVKDANDAIFRLKNK